MPGDVRRKYTPDGTVVEVRNFSNKCNGMTYDADLNLLVCEHVTSSLVRESADGTREIIAQEFEGEELNSPNDVCVHSSGRDLLLRPLVRALPRASGTRASGGSASRACTGSRRAAAILELIVGRDEFEMPNGICFNPDETLFYINDTPGAYIKVYDAAPDGSISNGRMFFEGVGSGVIEEGIPDGMKCDERGNIWVTGPGGIWVISPRASTSARSSSPRTRGTSRGAARTGTRSTSRAPPRCTPFDDRRPPQRAVHGLGGDR